MMWKWLAGAGVTLIGLLRIVTFQRDKARQQAKQEQARAEAQEAIREVENRLAQAQNKQAQARERVQNELDQSKGQRPTGDFGDSRLRMHDRADN